MKKKLRIVIADDDRDLVDALTLRCRTLGLEVTSTSNGLNAVRVITEIEPDLVILDVNMPAGTGLGVCEMMAGEERLSKIPVIILTAKSDPQTIRRCHDMLAYYVAKNRDVWPRIEPLLYELLDLDPAATNTPTTVCATDAPRRAAADESPRQPLAATAPSAEIAREVDLKTPDGKPGLEPFNGPWVLCIDDDPDFAFGLKLRLEQHGIGIECATAGMEGYRQAFTSPARAILLDYELPNGNGDYVLRRLKENPVTKDIPVIVMTGHRDRALARKMFNMGAARFLNKPVDWDVLWQELRQYIGPRSTTFGQASPCDAAS